MTDALEERLALALAAGKMGTWEWDVPAGKVSWSPLLEAIHGLEPGSFPGTFDAFAAGVHPEDRPRLLGEIQHTVDERRAELNVSYRIARPDGAVRWVEARGRL